MTPEELEGGGHDSGFLSASAIECCLSWKTKKMENRSAARDATCGFAYYKCCKTSMIQASGVWIS